MYTRLINLRTCGYFSLVKSDYGTEYKTTEFISSEALYASFTRERTRVFGSISENMENDFLKWYDVRKEPIWFLPGIFNSLEKSEHVFNVIDELRPTTSKYSIYKKGEWTQSSRSFLPTFGSTETMVPNQVFTTWILSNKKNLLENYHLEQVFLLGKKRTMVQVVGISEIGVLEKTADKSETWPLPLQLEDLSKFQAYELLWHTPRYLIAKGITQNALGVALAVSGKKAELILPVWWIEKLHWLQEEAV